MRKYTMFAVALFMAQQSFANISSLSSMAASDSGDVSLKQCENVVNACLNGGFDRAGAPGKSFWGDCMKPALLNQTVTGVTFDPKDVADCRQFKITKMQKELKELEQASKAK